MMLKYIRAYIIIISIYKYILQCVALTLSQTMFAVFCPQFTGSTENFKHAVFESKIISAVSQKFMRLSTLHPILEPDNGFIYNTGIAHPNEVAARSLQQEK